MNLEKIKNKIENDGYIKINNFLEKKEFDILKQYVDDKIITNNNNFFLVDKSRDKIFTDNKKIYYKFLNLFQDLIGYENIDTNEKIYRVLRYIKGSQTNEESFKFHFDAHYYTILIPIHIPKREKHENGDLLIIPNLRKLHRNLMKNIIQKIFYQSKLYRKYLIKNLKNKTKRLILEEGNIYIFNGYRSLHGNMNIHQKDKRATILLHYHDVIKDSKLIKLNRLIRQKKESKKIKL